MLRSSALALLAATCLIAAEPPPAVNPTPPPVTPAAKPAPKAYLGIAIDPAAAATFDGKGLAILRVEPNSPAAVMGLQAADRLLSCDDSPLKTPEDLKKAMSTRKPGDTIRLEFIRPHGKQDLAETMKVSGVLQEEPQGKVRNLGTQLNELQERIAELSKKTKEPTLAEVLQRLEDIERDLPKAAEQFKKIYPNGEFRIAISMEITSDKNAKDPLNIEVGGKPGDKPKVEAPADKPKADEPKKP